MMLQRRENTSLDNLRYVLHLFNSLGIRYWLDGGWGVDVLYGAPTREHRDIDIDFDAAYTSKVLQTLLQEGYHMETDALPVRAELYSPEYGYIDIHPFRIDAEGHMRQVNPAGGFFEFADEWFGTVLFADVEIPCITTEGQIIFHSGYELREKDRMDLKTLQVIQDRNRMK